MRDLLHEYQHQLNLGLEGSIYHKTQIELAYNSNHIEGSRLTEDQTRQIFETKTVNGPVRVDDVQETSNHFRLFTYALETAEQPLSLSVIKEYHRILKSGTTQAFSDPIFEPGVFKSLPNEVGGVATVAPSEVPRALGDLLERYNNTDKSFDALVGFHWRFERIHPFQDGNGRVGRMIMFRECLVHDILPFIVQDDMKQFYYRGLARYEEEHGWLIDTCRSFQDVFEVRFMPLVPHVAPPRRG